MAANPINVVDTLLAVQYDGTNSGDIVALDAFDFSNSTENDGTWSFQSPPDSTSFTFHAGDWILYAQNQVASKIIEGDFARIYSCNALCEDVASQLSVAALGVASVVSLEPDETATVTVTLQPAMPDDSYTAYASKFAGTSLADLTINSVTVVDEDTVQVAVHNTGLATITGASLLVHAVA